MTGCPMCLGPSVLRGVNGHDPACASRARSVTGTAVDPDTVLAALLGEQDDTGGAA